MSHDATRWALRQRGLNPAQWRVLYWLAHHHNGKTGQCNPQQSTLADECEISRASVNRCLDALVEKGLIKRRPTFDPVTKKQRATQYDLKLGAAAQQPEFDFDQEEKAMSQNDTRPQDVVPPCPEMRHGIEGENDQNPCLKNDETRVSKCDTKNIGIEQGSLCAEDAHTQFNILWDVFPKPRDQEKSEKLFLDAVSRGVDPDHIISSAKQYAAEQKGNGLQYVAGLGRWLEAERWKDFDPVPEKSSTVDEDELIRQMCNSPSPAVRQAGFKLRQKKGVS